ncbi:MAG: SDR family NAD(P)-dependent oxidoreductase, partial [Clostridia bacterium]|nr:SDR family NAD(P)-dependent oxidoreductase [Clostridia bacterium]
MDYNRSYFTGKVAVVTGGASGIGLALCEELLECGAKAVVLADFNEKNLRENEARLERSYPGKVKGIMCNVTVEDDVKAMIAQAAAFGGDRLDLLINCAGAGLVGKFTREPDGLNPDNPYLARVADNDAWTRGMELNLWGALYGCRAAVPVMLAQKEGQIVNIISGIAFSPFAYQSMYAATKAALNALTLALRSEFADYGIKFNSATPGTTATPIFLQAGGKPEGAQTPHQSASRILNGVAGNERLILGDDGDVDGAKHCFLPDEAGRMIDEIYLKFARERRGGITSFSSSKSESVQISPGLKMLYEISEATRENMNEKLETLSRYIAGRDAESVDKAYYAGKVAAVTGAASGVGLALCEALLSYGAEKITMADWNEENLKKHEARLNEKYPGRVQGVKCNAAIEGDVRNMVASAADFGSGRLDLLINCAGVGQMGMTFDAPDSNEISGRTSLLVEPPKRWDDIYSVNFYGPLYGCRAALEIMLGQKEGQIVNVISGTAYTPMPYQAIYSSAKAALNALTLVLRYEYWDCG